MPKLTAKPKAEKPKKPRKDFPLTPHPNGRWCKKIRGRLHYFGKWDDPDGALDEWRRVKDDLLAGKKPRDKQPEGMVVGDLVNKFLNAKRKLVENGERRARTLADYYQTCARIVEAFGRDRLLSDLHPDDFSELREKLAKPRGFRSLANEIQRVRTVFAYAHKQRYIKEPASYGDSFNKPSASAIDGETQEKGERIFEAADLRRIISACGVPLKAMVLLGINCGFGNNDCATLKIRAVDLEAGWVSHRRPKTNVARRCKLWPETVEAIRKAIAERPSPKEEQDDELLFVTKYGGRWAKGPTLGKEKDKPISTPGDNPLTKEFRKVLNKLNLHRDGLGFYCLRHTFNTIGGEALDEIAVGHVMGHKPHARDMGAKYRHRISDNRRIAISEHVRQWLLLDGRGKDEKEPEGGWTLA